MILALAICKAQFTVSGQISDTIGIPVPEARITLFDSSQTYFQEERTDAAGVYLFSNVPSGNYFLGIEKLNKEYIEQSISVSANFTLNTTLYTETEQGIWNIIIQSPEPLGGTNLGILMPDGKIFYCHDTRDPFYFDPILNDTIGTSGSANVQGCVGPIQTEDGKIWFIGGALVPTYGPGSQKVKSFDPSSNTWQFQPDMLDWRWYPSVIQLPDSRILIAGGGGLNNPIRTNTSEVYDLATGTSVLTDTMAIGNEVSPIVLLYDGKVLMTHRPPQVFDPVTNQWDLTGDFVQSPRLPNGDHSDCEIVLMPDGEVIAIGYKSFTPGIYGTFVERYNPISGTWALGSSILPIRSRAKTVLLPDKNILVIGGEKENPADTTSTNQWGYMNLCDMYDPSTDSWRRLNRLNYKREYHCNAILVPDGRIIAVGGEGRPGNDPPFSVIEAFNPPYLFRGVRPEIINLTQTSFGRGANIDFDFLKTDSITEVLLMSNAVVTHFMNSGNNRYISLNYSQTGSHITAILPSDSITLPPGIYMLFVMVDDIPSIAEIVRIQNTSVTSSTQITQGNQLLHIFPNPASEFITLNFLSEPYSSEIEIFNTIGETVLSAANKNTIDISAFNKGLYFITVKARNNFYSLKFIKL
ncbi:MAG TPA: DUF1929 domain-containing protein [Bacteroidia bacterium]|nr:DUF1929 domain-containing protein [Bacteroidia bacterium]